jgi:hypothetical protein
MPRYIMRILAILAASLLLLGACGDDDGADTAAPSESADDGDAAAPDAGDDGDDPSNGDDAPATTGAPRGDGSLPNLAGINDFCGLWQAFDGVDEDFLFGYDPDMTEEEAAAAAAQGFQFLQAFAARAAQLSPDAIRADMAMFASAMAEYNAVLAEYDYDFMAMAMAGSEDPEAMERLELMESDEFMAASERIEAFVLEECGVDLS